MSSNNPPLSRSFYDNLNNPLAPNAKSKAARPTSKKNVLRPVAVKERSKSIQGCKEIKNKDPFSTTIIFLILPTNPEGEESKSQEKEDKKQMPIRISVFCDTGTIGTAKVIDGQVRQSFRRNVTSLDVLERLLRNPEGPVEINDQLIGVTDTDVDDEVEHSENSDAGSVPNFKKGVELADVALCILEGEREKLAKHLRHLDDEAEKEAAEARAVAEELAEQQQLEEEQRKQEAAKQKQQQQQPNKQPAAQQQLSKQLEQQPSGEKQAQMLHKAMSSSNSDNQKSNRIGRRRNKLNNLRKNRNLNNSKKPGLSQSAHEMNKTKRRGGKQGAASDSKRSSSDGKQQTRSARLATKMTTITGNTDGPTFTNNRANDSNRSDNDSDSDASSAMSTTEYNKKVTNNRNKVDSFKNCGYEFHFKLPAEVMNQVDQCLRDIAKMNKVVKAVATNGRGTVFLYGNGGVAYTPAIPKALYQKLRQLRSSSFSSRPCFVALGTRDRYYVAFNDGSADWKGSSSLDKMLKKRVIKNPTGGLKTSTGGNTNDAASILPRSVAFGATYDTFFVVFNDGSWEYQGRSVPKSLEKKLKDRNDAADLVICNLGPNGEWFLKSENGKMWWSGITPELDLVLKKITKKGYLHNMDFGENGSYFVSYDEE